MPAFIRIKHYIINLDTLTYIRVEDNHIDFGFAFPIERTGGESFVRIEKGKVLSESDFEELKEFVLGLPEPDRVIVV